MNVNLYNPLSPESMFGQWAIVKRTDLAPSLPHSLLFHAEPRHALGLATHHASPSRATCFGEFERHNDLAARSWCAFLCRTPLRGELGTRAVE